MHDIKRGDFLKIRILWPDYPHVPKRYQVDMPEKNDVLLGVVAATARLEDFAGRLFLVMCDDGQQLVLHSGQANIYIERLVLDGIQDVADLTQLDDAHVERTIHHGE